MPSLIPTFYAPAATSSAPVPSTTWGSTVLFDHTINTFIVGDSGDLQLGNEATTLSQWVINALITPRMRHYVHQRRFGSDFDLLLGKSYPESVLKHLAEGFIKDALVDPRITAVKKITTIIQGKNLAAEITITNANGFDQQFHVRWSV